MPASAQAITTRAVRLPGGDPIALSEIADVSLATVPAMRTSTGAGLRLAVYPVNAAAAARVAERVNAYLGWMRANGMVPADIRVETVFSEAEQTRRWSVRTIYVCAIYLAAVFVFAYALFGARACRVAIGGAAVWLSVSLAVLAALGGSLNPMTTLGLMAAFVPVAAIMTAVSLPAVAWLFALFAFVLALSTSEGSPAVTQAGYAFGIACAVAAFMGWLAKAWIEKGAPRERTERRHWLMLGLSIGVGAVAAVLVQVYVPSNIEERGVLRILGNSETALNEFSQELLAPWREQLGQSPQYSAAQEQHWHLDLEMERLEALGITVAQVGRALTVATVGLTVGEVADADVRLPLRLRLTPQSSGENFERLVLRGELPDERAVYLHDVGSAHPVTDVRERIRIDGVPAVEITLTLHDAVARREAERSLSELGVPDAFRYEWKRLPAY
jgi:multidrug efflux pump subunit AcrB